MSKGHGRVERTILELLAQNRTLTAPMMAALIYQPEQITLEQVTKAQHASVRRALSNLQKAGKVVKLGHLFRGERYSYASPESALAITTQGVKRFGKSFLRDHPELAQVYATHMST
jgi:hypothetical protein